MTVRILRRAGRRNLRFTGDQIILLKLEYTKAFDPECWSIRVIYSSSALLSAKTDIRHQTLIPTHNFSFQRPSGKRVICLVCGGENLKS